MVIVGVVAYVKTPRGLRSQNTVWASTPLMSSLSITFTWHPEPPFAWPHLWLAIPTTTPHLFIFIISSYFDIKV